MAEAHSDPTEEPTPQRILKAREKGQVAVSRDFSAAFGFVVLVSILAATAPVGVARLLDLYRRALATACRGGAADFVASAGTALHVLGPLLAVPLGATLVVAVLVGTMQTGGLFAWQAARTDFTRLSPATGLKKLLSPRTVVEMARGLFKVSIVLLVAVNSMGWGASALPRLAGARPSSVLAALGVFSRRLGIHVALVLVAWGAIDWLIVRRRHRRSMMMTREEVKREYKEAEGDPKHRSERQRLHRELGEQRMVDDVRKADFVVVNPDHIAVAVRYDRDADAAPTVVAKGERLLAERIKQVAREAGVPIYRDVGLARALNELPEGDEIPEILYEAVAELLRVLWDIDQGKGVGPTAIPEAAGHGGSDRWAGQSDGGAVEGGIERVGEGGGAGAGVGGAGVGAGVGTGVGAAEGEGSDLASASPSAASRPPARSSPRSAPSTWKRV